MIVCLYLNRWDTYIQKSKSLECGMLDKVNSGLTYLPIDNRDKRPSRRFAPASALEAARIGAIDLA